MSPLVDPYEELAALFLSDEEEESRQVGTIAHLFADSSRPSPKASGAANGAAGAVLPAVEVAMVGHLPVMGGLWLTQYADQLGRREGPVALVRLERGQVGLELLRAAEPADRGGRGGIRLDSASTLEEVLELLADVVVRWIVCPSSDALDDRTLQVLRETDGVELRLLTGSDDAATVAAYRMVKSLAERWERDGAAPPSVGLVILGAAPDRVQEVAEKLNRTTKAFLDIDLPVVAQHQRMDAIETAGRRSFPMADDSSELGADEFIARLRAALRQRRATARAQGDRAPRIASLRFPAADREVASARKLGPKMPPQAPSERASGHSVLAAEPPVVAVESPAARATRPESWDAGECRARGAPATSVAAALGLAPLAPRCPTHRDVELAVDAAGRLHLVTPFEAIADLRPVEAWVHAQFDLLRRACPEIRDADPRITSHVVTRDAPDIVPLHGSGLRLHLEIDLPDGDRRIVPLNR